MSTPKLPSKEEKDTKLTEFLKSGGRKGAQADFNKIIKKASKPTKKGK